MAKTIRAVRGQSAELALDVFNVGNLLNRNWGAEYQVPVGISTSSAFRNEVRRQERDRRWVP